VGVVGLGMAGSDHLAAIARCEEAQVICVADRDPVALVRARQQAPAIATYEDYRAMLTREDLDLVVIATPHHLHARMALDAFGAGKHVLCEKPLAVTPAECDAMIAAARAAGRRLFPVQNQRASPMFRRLKRLIGHEKMGKPVAACIQFLGYEGARMADPASWKGSYGEAGGGVLLDGGCHVLDLCNWYLGAPLGVVARCHRPEGWPAHKAETTAHVVVDYKCGAAAQVFATFEARLPGSFTQGILEIAVELFYEQGYAHAEYAYYGPAGGHRLLRYVCRSNEWHTVELAAEDGLDYDRHILACLLRGAEPVASPEEARTAVAVAHAAYEAASTGRWTPVG